MFVYYAPLKLYFVRNIGMRQMGNFIHSTSTFLQFKTVIVAETFNFK